MSESVSLEITCESANPLSERKCVSASFFPCRSNSSSRFASPCKSDQLRTRMSNGCGHSGHNSVQLPSALNHESISRSCKNSMTLPSSLHPSLRAVGVGNTGYASSASVLYSFLQLLKQGLIREPYLAMNETSSSSTHLSRMLEASLVQTDKIRLVAPQSTFSVG